MFCQALIGALQVGQAERGVLRVKEFGGVVTMLWSVRQRWLPATVPPQVGRYCIFSLRGWKEFRRLDTPLAIENDGQSIDDHVEETTDDQAQHEHRARK